MTTSDSLLTVSITSKRDTFLSISAKSRKVGVAIFSEDRLLYYNQFFLIRGGKSAPKVAADLVDELIHAHRPEYFVIEQIAYKQQRIPSFIEVRRSLFNLAKKHRLPVKECALDTARVSFCSDVKPIKDNIIQVLRNQYPEFKRFAPDEAGWHLTYYQPLFNAVILGFYFVKNKNTHQITTQLQS